LPITTSFPKLKLLINVNKLHGIVTGLGHHGDESTLSSQLEPPEIPCCVNPGHYPRTWDDQSNTILLAMPFILVLTTHLNIQYLILHDVPKIKKQKQKTKKDSNMISSSFANKKGKDQSN
jgi:hypothetical protein